MPILDRRDLLQFLGSAGLLSLLPAAQGCTDDPAPTPADASADGPRDASGDLAQDASADVSPDVAPTPAGFSHGVASGDPLPESVILWTRFTPAMPGATVEVTWQVSTTPDFAAIAREGTFTTNADRDYTVKVDVTGLTAGRVYHYRFRALGFTSPVGRTKTAPTGSLAHARFGIVSCSNLAFGYFHSYRNLAARTDLDAVIHLGDYIYEYGNNEYGSLRQNDPPYECLSLDDYRRRYRQYHREAELQAVHAAHPFVAVWDDHEFANDAWRDGAQNHMPMTEGAWADRRRAATQAYMEWMPIREQMDGRIYRRLQWGDLLDLVMVDTRVWGRDVQARDAGAAADPARQLLGDAQERWLIEQVTTSRARWKLVGQQIMIGQVPTFLNLDAWDGYPAARDRVFRAIRAMNVPNVVMLTGDIHSSWAMDLTETPANPMTYDPATGRGSLAVEFVCPAVTSAGFPDVVVPLLMQAMREMPHLRYVDGNKRGYVVVDVTPERTQGAWFYVRDITQPDGHTETAGPVFSTRNGQNHLQRDPAM